MNIVEVDSSLSGSPAVSRERVLCDKLFVTGLILVLLFGTYWRLPASLFVARQAPLQALGALRGEPGFTAIGFDEELYRTYVQGLIQGGLGAYPSIAQDYVEAQTGIKMALLPPTRFLYIFSAYAWHSVSGADAITSLLAISSLFSVLLLFLATVFSWRLGGGNVALGVAALMACSPMQIHMGQHALIDGFFAFWATCCLWLLWENLRRPGNRRLLVLYVLALASIVVTKENAMFTYIGLLVVLALNYWVGFGKVTRELVGCTVLGPLLGLVILIFLCGGVDTFVQTYRLLVTKASALPFAIATGDGPWYRYLTDLLLLSPFVLLLAVGKVFRLQWTNKPELFLVIFVCATYAVMCNVRYGMNLRYADIWDMPLRYLAVVAIGDLASQFRRHRSAVAAGLVTGLSLLDLRQYNILFVKGGLYELVPAGLLHALHIVK
ncbi:MAG: phospholipid carrier-dependent glycosyltransferase [Verrucomicrobiota bacterium]|nr:phospholipid carrier-dependent glycosyltransferase [Verrucomicrobiota bacterium]